LGMFNFSTFFYSGLETGLTIIINWSQSVVCMTALNSDTWHAYLSC
jgi:hypothetical protein